MCNLYTSLRSQEAMRRLFTEPVEDRIGNLQTGDIYPDQPAPIARLEGDAVVLEMARWGLPSPPQFHSKSGIDRGITNVRNTGSAHWRRWLGPSYRCLVPVERFAEPAGKGKGNVWFGLRDNRPGFFAGIRVPQWTSLRKLKDGETTDDLYGFLTCPPNETVAAVHPKAMPVVLTQRDEWQAWLHADWSEAKSLQRPLDDDELEVLEAP